MYLERPILGEIWEGGDIVGLGLAGLGWIIVDLSRCKLKKKKKRNTRGVDVMLKVFISS